MKRFALGVALVSLTLLVGCATMKTVARGACDFMKVEIGTAVLSPCDLFASDETDEPADETDAG